MGMGSGWDSEQKKEKRKIFNNNPKSVFILKGKGKGKRKRISLFHTILHSIHPTHSITSVLLLMVASSCLSSYNLYLSPIMCLNIEIVQLSEYDVYMSRGWKSMIQISSLSVCNICRCIVI
jgi:hypothetical protein